MLPLRLIILGMLPFCLSAQTFKSTDHILDEGNGIHLSLRRITTTHPLARILLLIHGGGSGAIASFDLDLPDHPSFAQELAAKGFIVYLMNVRGWENSTAPAYDSTDTSLVAGSCKEAATDIDAVVNYIREKEHLAKVSLFGWATGGHWVSYYTTLHNDKVDHLIVLNTLYGVKGPWSLSSSFADPTDSNRYNNRIPVYRESSRQAVIASRYNALPPGRRSDPDSASVEAYADLATSWNPQHTLRVPGGYRRESFNMAHGYQYWNARDIKVPTLIIRSQYDFWSRPIDTTAFYNDLTNAPLRKTLDLPNATHFAFLDKPDMGRDTLVDAIDAFIPRER
jgi:pimeloyl-ACP methyl ester carboxylesterase